MSDGMDRVVRVFLVDDHAVVLDGLIELLGSVPGLEVVGSATTAEQALSRIPAAAPDVAVLDVQLPDGNGVDVCRDVRASLPGTYCLMLTSYDDHDAVLASVLAGASGYVLKQVRTAELVDSIRQVALGRSLIDPAVIARVMDRVRETTVPDNRLADLTPREREVLDLMTDGLTNRQIGEQLFLSEKTVKNYVSSILGKLGIERRSQAAVLGAEARRNRA
ncbi:MAG TPA: response regulator transcription factor [Nocardioides sp.]|uniref:response regulator transcription factor n=1 Tax=Nocardioides sp. TaxID=35761 RepID=UPI002E3669F5|nr:response regulator transcription factor [Nocardioides sp.]HEX5088228.1 response regulator transcription factor [Nocardioides sp.]